MYAKSEIVEYRLCVSSYIEVYIYFHTRMALMETNGTGDWYSVVDALDELKISRRTLYHRINKGELQSKKDGKFRYIWIDDTVDLGNNIYTDTTETQNNNLLEELRSQVAYWKNQVEQKDKDLREQSMRHDATIFRILEQNQNLLESARSKPFWKFW